MTSITVELPESLKKRIEVLRRQRRLHRQPIPRLRRCRKNGRRHHHRLSPPRSRRRQDFDRYLQAVPDAKPAESDRLS